MGTRRIIPVVGIAILLAGLLWDPYSSAYDGSDAVRRAPLWQLSFAVLDIGVLFGILALSLRHRMRCAFLLLLAETAYYVMGNVALYMRDGPARFVHGFGAESNLGEHVIVLVVRAVLLGYLFWSSQRPLPSAA